MHVFNDLSLTVTLPHGESVEMAYRAWGDASAARHIIFVHGLTRNGRDFDRLAGVLALQDAFVLCPDMPGRGRSGWLAEAESYNYASYLACLQALMAQHPAKTWDYVGTSMGGILGMMLAATPNMHIRKLVLNDIGEKIPAAGMRRIAAYASKPQHFAQWEDGLEYLKTTFASFGLKTDEDWSEFAHISLRPVEPEGWTLAYDPLLTHPLAAYLDGDLAMLDIDLSTFWHAVKCPTLLLRGEISDILPSDIARKMAVEPHCTLVSIPDCGHAPALMAEDQIVLIADWLRS